MNERDNDLSLLIVATRKSSNFNNSNPHFFNVV